MSKAAADFFSEQEKENIVNAIKEAELNTSGEVRVHIENDCKVDVLDRAAYIFKQLDMHKTQLRNGVLVYLAINSKKFAIIGDVGINKAVATDFWDNVKETMLAEFKINNFTKGLSTGIIMAGEKLKAHFPYQSDDVNELSDEISFGKN